MPEMTPEEFLTGLSDGQPTPEGRPSQAPLVSKGAQVRPVSKKRVVKKVGQKPQLIDEPSPIIMESEEQVPLPQPEGNGLLTIPRSKTLDQFLQGPESIRSKELQGLSPKRNRDETISEYRSRIAQEAEERARKAGPITYRVGPKGDIFAEPVPQGGEDVGAFDERKRLLSQAQRRRSEQQFGFPQRIQKPTVQAKLKESLNKIDKGEFISGLKAAGEAILDPVATGLTDPIRQSGLLISGIGKELGAQSRDPLLDYALQVPRESTVEGLGADLLKGLGSTGTFALGSAIGGGSLVGAYGALSNAGSVYEEALKSGFSNRQALLSSIPAALIGYLERFGFGGKGLEEAISNSILHGGLEEFGQESLTQLLNNINARILSGYDPNRAIAEGVLESGLMGAILGGGIPGGAKLGGEVATSAQRIAEMIPRTQIKEAAKAFLASEEGSWDPKQTAEKLNNLINFISQSKVRDKKGDPIPVYHGTQSSKPIEQVDISKADTDALYGPGFYTTQDPEVAAGEGGYSNTKRNVGNVNQQDVDEFFTPGNIIPAYGSTWDKVLEYQRSDTGYGFNVKVIQVNPDTGEPIQGEYPRWHSTRPDEPKITTWKDFKAYDDVMKEYTSKYGKPLPDDIADEAMNRAKGARALATGPKPHAYKLYLDIRNPFDIDAPLSPEQVAGFMKDIQNEVRPDWPSVPFTGSLEGAYGNTIYLELSTAFDQDKAKVNEFLAKKGFDGITHIGGSNWNSKSYVFSTLEEAQAKAEEVGGKVGERTSMAPMGGVYDILSPYNPPTSLVKSFIEATKGVTAGTYDPRYLQEQIDGLVNFGVPQDVMDDATARALLGPPKEYTVEGHRVWIAFRPDQVKSAYGNSGSFSGDPLSIGEVSNTTRDLEERAQQAGYNVALTQETRETYSQEAKELLGEMSRMDPRSPGFSALQDRWIELNTALTDGQAFSSAKSWTELEQMLQEKAMPFNTNEGIDTSLIQERQPETRDQAELQSTVDLKKETTITPSGLPSDEYQVRQYADSRAPVILVPDTFFEAYKKAFPSNTGFIVGLAMNKNKVSYYLKQISEYLPPAEQRAMYEQFVSISSILNEIGGDRIAIINTALDPGGIYETAIHELIHAGQSAAFKLAAPSVYADDPNRLGLLHSTNISAHPLVKKIFQDPSGQKRANGSIDHLAMEMVAYFAEGSDILPATKDEQANYLVDYFFDMLDTYGPNVLRAFENNAYITPEIEQRLSEAKGYYGNVLELEDINRFGQEEDSDKSRLAGQTNASPLSIRDDQTADQGQTPSAVESQDLVQQQGQSGESEGVTPGGPTDIQDKSTSLEKWQDDPFFKAIINDPYMLEVANSFEQALREADIIYDPEIPPSLQVYEALTAGKIKPERIAPQLQKMGLSWEQFATGVLNTYSTAGRILQPLSRIDRNWGQLIKDNPELAKKLIPAKRLIEVVIRDLSRGVLGQGMWDRSGGLIRKMVLGRLSIASVNAITTSVQLPVRAATAYGAATLDTLAKRSRGELPTDVSFLKQARKAADNELQAVSAVLQAMKPKELTKALIGRSTQRSLDVENIISTLSKTFPEVKTKLEGLSSGLDKIDAAEVSVGIAQFALQDVKDPKERAALRAKLDRIDKHIQFNKGLMGKVLGKIEWGYELPIRPQVIQEYFFRRPYFVGALKAELGRKGIDLVDKVNSGTIHTINERDVFEAVDRALEFTMAYNPHNGPDASRFERAAAKTISALNDLPSPISFVLAAFPKPMYTGLKFMYEYSFLGAVVPGSKLFTKSRYEKDSNGKDILVSGLGFRDFERLSKAAVGTVMYVMALALRQVAGGDEWWQLKTGLKTKDGRPRYVDVRRYPPFNLFWWVSDRVPRLLIGKGQDIDFKKEIPEILGSLQRIGESGGIALESLQSLADWWGEEDITLKHKTGWQAVGRQLSIPFTPLVNIRDLYAQFSEEEALQRDTLDRPFLGPSMDLIPLLRRNLPVASSPFIPPPNYTTESPGLSILGFNLRPGAAWAVAEWQSLGINPRRFLKRDPDSKIDRAMNEAFIKAVQENFSDIKDDPSYARMTPIQKRAWWEEQLEDTAIATEARDTGLEANPEEAAKREEKKEAGGPLRWEAEQQERKKLKKP